MNLSDARDYGWSKAVFPQSGAYPKSEFLAAKTERLVLRVRGQEIVVQADETGLSIGKQMKIPGARKLHLRVVADNTSQDVYFGQHGLYYSPRMTPPQPEKSIHLEVEGGSATFSKLQVHQLKSVW